MKKLQTAMVVQPLGLPTLERIQRPNETIVSGTNGFYFLSLAKDTPKYRSWWRYEYFGVHGYHHLNNVDGFKDGIAKLRKTDLIKDLKGKLNA